MKRCVEKDLFPEIQKEEQPSTKISTVIKYKEETIIELAIQQRVAYLPVSQLWTKEKISEITDRRIPNASSSCISKFLAKHGWPSRKVKAQNSKELWPTLNEEELNFQSEIQEYGRDHQIQPERIFIGVETW
jgi:hypothetical protein